MGRNGGQDTSAPHFVGGTFAALPPPTGGGQATLNDEAQERARISPASSRVVAIVNWILNSAARTLQTRCARSGTTVGARVEGDFILAAHVRQSELCSGPDRPTPFAGTGGAHRKIRACSIQAGGLLHPKAPGIRGPVDDCISRPTVINLIDFYKFEATRLQRTQEEAGGLILRTLQTERRPGQIGRQQGLNSSDLFA